MTAKTGSAEAPLPPTFKELALAIAQQLSQNPNCMTHCYCGRSLRFAKLQSYPHDGGWDIRHQAGTGYSLRPYWLYLHCDGCGSDHSLNKLGMNLRLVRVGKLSQSETPPHGWEEARELYQERMAKALNEYPGIARVSIKGDVITW